MDFYKNERSILNLFFNMVSGVNRDEDSFEKKYKFKVFEKVYDFRLFYNTRLKED